MSNPESTTTVKPLYVVPGCSLFIRSDDPLPIEQLVAIVFQLADANPGATVDFSIEVKPK